MVRSQRSWIGLAQKNIDATRWPASAPNRALLAARFQELRQAITGERGIKFEDYAARNKRSGRVVLVAALTAAIVGLVASLSLDLSQNQWIWLDLCALFTCLLPLVALAYALLDRVRTLAH